MKIVPHSSQVGGYLFSSSFCKGYKNGGRRSLVQTTV